MSNKEPFDRELFEKRYTVDLEDNIRYMNPKVWEDLNRQWTHGPTFSRRWRWFLIDMSIRWDNFKNLIGFGNDDYDDYYEEDY